LSRRPLVGAVLVLCSAVGYATLPTLLKVAYDHGADPLGVLVPRFAIAAPPLVLYLAARGRAGAMRAAAPAAALPATIFLLQSLTFFEAVDRVSASLAVLLLFTYPLIVAAGAWAVLGERMTRGGVAIAVAGSVGIALSVGVSGDANVAGVAFGLASGALFAVFLVVSKRALSSRVDAVTLTALVYAAMALGYLVMGLAAGMRIPGDAVGWLAVVGVAALGTTAPTVLLLSGLHHLTAGAAAMLSVVEPVVAVVLAAALLGEVLEPLQVAGIAIVVTALAALGLDLTRRAAVPAA
jgi:drug/metabolite transporter (DMT)-like permease